ncbi:hypothetical protein BZG36_00267 [Bifiguratus adelaidae]|uniref:Lysozyme n=1 Tax=Bifiguratus adelaidae TaxID=1938954 RepID=A0A261Y818_9FUNG|nr:hypothetical protein BZG36_00267 [Bifiguratus adelaidae]
MKVTTTTLAVFCVAIVGCYTSVPGLDVTANQPSVNWGTIASYGAKFAYMKATEGTYYTNPDFSSQYIGSYNAGESLPRSRRWLVL